MRQYAGLRLVQDGKPLAIVIDNTHATGLQVRFTPSMIDVKREEREARGQKAE